MRSSPCTSGIILSSSVLALLCACGGGGSSTNTNLSTNHAPTATAPSAGSAGTNLIQYQTYTFTTTGTDPDIGDSVATVTWDFGDGSTPVTVAAPFTVTHAFVTAAFSVTVKATPKDTHGLDGSAASTAFVVAAAPNPFTAALISPAAEYVQPVSQGSTANVVFRFAVTYTGSGTVSAANLAFNTGTTAATGTPVVVPGSLDGLVPWTVTVPYPATTTVGGTYVATPSLTLSDSMQVQSSVLSFPAITFQTVVANPTPPSINITSPDTPSTQVYALQTASLGLSVTDTGTFPTTVTVDWNDGTPTWSTTLTGSGLATGMSPSGAISHQYLSPGTYTVKVTAVDTQASNNTAAPQTRTFVVLENKLPTATITSPQASGSLPLQSQFDAVTLKNILPDTMASQLALPPVANYPQAVVIPAGGKLNFAGQVTTPTSGEQVTVRWTFQGGNPGVSTSINPGSVTFNGVPGQIIAYLVEMRAIDTFGRNSSQVGEGLNAPDAMAGAGFDTSKYRKWVIVDGTQTQNFYLNFKYRQKTDSSQVPIALTDVITAANGLGANVQIFQDGVSNTYAVQSGNTANVVIPVRSNLPFWISVPAFGGDSLGYVMEIPNAPTGPFRDPSLAVVPPVANAASFTFANAAAPFNPTLNLVTGQGYAPEGQEPAMVFYQGTTSLDGNDPAKPPRTNRWFNFLSVPATDATATQGVVDNSIEKSFAGLAAFQLFPEWLLYIKTQEPDLLGETIKDANSTSEGGPADLGFKMDMPTYSALTAKSVTYSATQLQAFRVPPGVTDPYNLSLGTVSWNLPSCFVDLHPTQAVAGAPALNQFNTMLFGDPGTAPFSGGIGYLWIPYDVNDQDRLVLPVSGYLQRFESEPFPVFTATEYLWSTAWVRPQVLNTALLSWTDTFHPQDFTFFRYSDTAVWPKYTGSIPITPNGGFFDLNVTGSGTFDASSPFAAAGTPSSTAVGRFWWTAFSPKYNAAPGAAIARTWLADPSTKLPPTSFAGTASDANVTLGLLPPVDPVVDKRARLADGSVDPAGGLGGYRITWFNPTKAADGVTCVPPDFWAVELTANGTTTHFLLPASYPAVPASGPDTTQTTAAQLLTDARMFLPSGNAPSAGPGANDRVAPGYCWFDVPKELRPTSGSASIIIFALKSILANNPAAGAYPRPLNRTDWIDAIKTATANISINSKAGKDLGYVYKVPFNFGWDIVVANCEPTTVAP